MQHLRRQLFTFSLFGLVASVSLIAYGYFKYLFSGGMFLLAVLIVTGLTTLLSLISLWATTGKRRVIAIACLLTALVLAFLGYALFTPLIHWPQSI